MWNAKIVIYINKKKQLIETKIGIIIPCFYPLLYLAGRRAFAQSSNKSAFLIKIHLFNANRYSLEIAESKCQTDERTYPVSCGSSKAREDVRMRRRQRRDYRRRQPAWLSSANLQTNRQTFQALYFCFFVFYFFFFSTTRLAPLLRVMKDKVGHPVYVVLHIWLYHA